MRVMVFGAMQMSGKSRKSGLSYNMSRLYVASDLADKVTDDYKRVACGFEAAEVEAEDAVIATFHDLSHKGAIRFPVVMDLETDMRMQGGRLVPVVVGIVSDKKAAA